MIDHLVLATPSVDATAAIVRDTWGVPVIAGGSHVGMGTRNELTGLGGTTYLEIVGPDSAQPAPGFPRPFGVDDLTVASLVAWCARPTRPLAQVLERLSAEGIDLGPATNMSRARPDGTLLQWQLTFPLLAPPHAGTLPFLIDWLDSTHPTASLPHDARLRRLTITHPQPDLVRTVLNATGGSTSIAIEQGAPSLHASVDTPRGVVSLGR
ncbi:unannotated protein [freshwater metagenome]|uniref:Unannotated protein n=1 Tax=freshwater metagenome TaxID=449393 RepID=A0A6J6A7F9_9ZZZZ